MTSCIHVRNSPNGDKTYETVDKDGKGNVEISGYETTDGKTAEYAMKGTTEGLTLTKITGLTGDIGLVGSVPCVDGNTYPIVALGDGLFEGDTGITSVTIEAGITKIGDSAFSGCKNLKVIYLGVQDNYASMKGKSKSALTLGKNCLKGTSKKLKIFVTNKADQKALKKQLKKAGAPKAKVKVSK